jgi:hypothetical protein
VETVAADPHGLFCGYGQSFAGQKNDPRVFFASRQ